jgi:exopolyphosphatase / guanosine-5'-triphosphate,3'-diphosphate pyrophosphatase
MDHIVPRWEWRTFGQDFGAAEARFAALEAVDVQNSEEVYLVSAATDANVKVRDGLLDIKRLERVDEHGLEQWRPELKAPFPIGASAVAQAWVALGLPESAPAASALSLDQLVAALTSSRVPIRVMNVQKTRTRYRVDGCISELTDVVVDGTKMRTVAIEDADAEKVVAAVRSMALDGFRNISYPRALKQLLGWPIPGAQP